jgi:2-hydroxy-6-oxonona-2,4-dienedioate hydrolase
MSDQNEILHRSIWGHLRTLSLEQGYVEAGGIRTRYAHAGDPSKPALLMLHGTAGTWECFCANLASHSEHFNCYAIDMVGSGFSSKPDVDYEIKHYVKHAADFLDVFGISKASLMGCSLGAWVVAAFALAHPQRTDRIILLSAAGLFANASNMSRIRNVRTKSVEDPSWSNIKPIFDHLLAREDARIPDIIALRQAMYRQPGMVNTMNHILCLQEESTRKRNLLSEDDWKSIQAPALSIGSLADKDEYLETAQRVAKLIPNARYVPMEGVGHWPQFEDPDTFNPISIRFLLGQD